MATATPPDQAVAEIGEHRFVIRNLGWDGYQVLLKVVGDRGPRLSYAHGDVELMSPLFPHEGFRRRLGRMVETLTEELDIPMKSAGSSTLDREDLDRGVEADESYYLANVGRVLDKKQINLEVDPPPDLAIEIEITNSILKKVDIYARIGVPELWKFDGERLVVFLLGPDGRYVPSDSSAAFPFVPMNEIERFLNEGQAIDETRWVRSFRAWVRQVLLPLRRDPE